MLFVMVSLWSMAFLDIDLGHYTLFVPGIAVLGGLVLLTKTSWFFRNIKEPVNAVMEQGTTQEIFIHFQLFTVVCGVLGLGGGIFLVSALYPIGLREMMETMAGTEDQMALFRSTAHLAPIGGLAFGVVMVFYILAVVRDRKFLSAAILLGGLLLFFLLGGIV